MRVRWISGVVTDTTSSPGRILRKPAVTLVPGIHARWAAPPEPGAGPQYFVGVADVTDTQLAALTKAAARAGVELTILTESTKLLTTQDRQKLTYTRAEVGDTEDGYIERCVREIQPQRSLLELEAGLTRKIDASRSLDTTRES